MQTYDDYQRMFERLEALHPIAKKFASDAYDYHWALATLADELGYDDDHPARMRLDELQSAADELLLSAAQAENQGPSASLEELQHLLTALRSAVRLVDEAVSALQSAKWTRAVPKVPSFGSPNVVRSNLLSMLEWVVAEAARKASRISTRAKGIGRKEQERLAAMRKEKASARRK